MHEVLAACGISVEGNKALCPFHPDRHPSMVVYRDGYHCFVCGAHGDAIDLVQHIKGCDRKTAAQTVAGIAGVSITVADDYTLLQRRIQRELQELEREIDALRLDVIDADLEYLREVCYNTTPYSSMWCDAWRRIDALERERDAVDERVLHARLEQLRRKHHGRN